MSAISRREFLQSAATYAAAAGLVSAGVPKLRANPLGMPIGVRQQVMPILASPVSPNTRELSSGKLSATQVSLA